MSQYSEMFVPLRDAPQKWWRIVCSYGGESGCVGASIGNAGDEAKDTFLLGRQGIQILIAIAFQEHRQRRSNQVKKSL